MFHCPQCQAVLHQVRGQLGVYWICPAEHGRTATIELVRKLLPPPIVKALWQDARSGEYAGRRPCPSCSRAMAEIPIIDGQQTVLDVCAGCRLIWFDAGEYESLPESPDAADLRGHLTADQVERLALAELELLRSRERAEEFEERCRRGGRYRLRGAGLSSLFRVMWRL